MLVMKGLRSVIGDEGILEKTADRKQAAEEQLVILLWWTSNAIPMGA
jgi:hypothetical protein